MNRISIVLLLSFLVLSCSEEEEDPSVNKNEETILVTYNRFKAQNALYPLVSNRLKKPFRIEIKTNHKI